jgi:TonB family protein
MDGAPSRVAQAAEDETGVPVWPADRRQPRRSPVLRHGQHLAAAVLAAGGLAGCADTPPASEPQILTGPGFPSPGSFYPPEALRAAQDGTVAVHVCLDTQGRLQGAPAVSASSGNSLLDAAALRLAQAGSGQYLPVTRKGVPRDACGQLRVAFTLPVDPRWPVLWHRLWVISGEMQDRLQEVNRNPMVMPAAGFDARSREQLQQARHALQELRQQNQGLAAAVTAYLGAIDKLETDPAIPEAERTAFHADGVWSARRHELQSRTQAFTAATEGLVAALGGLFDYIAQVQPLLAGPAGAKPPTPQQERRIKIILARVAAAQDRFKAAEQDLHALFAQH